MTLKEQIQKDFIAAMKAGDKLLKSTLSGLKAKITEEEKKENKTLTEQEVLNVIVKSIKQRQDSFDAFQEGGRQELALAEYAEMVELEKYLPMQMTIFEMEVAARNLMKEVISSADKPMNQQVIIGKTIGAFNKRYKGKADLKKVKAIVESVAK